MKLRVLITSDRYSKKFSGGAYKSLRIIVKGLLEQKDLSLKILARENSKEQNDNLSLIPLNPLISLFQTKLQKTLRALGSDYYLYTLQILKEINNFKPHIIITQRDVAFPTIFCANITKTPVIYIVRDTINFCPKHVDIFQYGQSCPEFGKKKNCHNCINKWRTLRVYLGDKTKGWEKSLKAKIYTVFYKFRYYLVRLNFRLMNKAINVLASPWLKETLSKTIKSDNIFVKNITPIQKIDETSIEVGKTIKNKVDSIKNPILFITPSFKGYQKGENFVLKLADNLPEKSMILIVGKKMKLNESIKGVLNLGFVSSNVLNYIYKKSKLTLVPSFLTDTFGRIAIESLINKTPVIASPNCGVHSFFKEKKFLKILPLKLDLWEKGINEMIKNPPTISEKDINQIYEQFSVNKSKNDFINLIKKSLKLY